jgi:hypothetical protein
MVLAVLPIAVCRFVGFSHQYADAAVEHFALGLVATCCSVYGVQGTSMTNDHYTLTYTTHMCDAQCRRQPCLEDV